MATTNQRKIILAMNLVCFSILAPQVASPQTDLKAKLRSFTPQEVIDEANRDRDMSGDPNVIQIPFTRADLDGTGQFDFIVAGYYTLGQGTLRVFRIIDGELRPVGGVEGNPNLDFGNMEIELVDVDNDGKPEVALESSGVTGAAYRLFVYRWTGHSLHLMNFGDTFRSAEFHDLDGNGILDLVTPSSAPNLKEQPSPPNFQGIPYMVFKLKNGDYLLAFTSKTDPRGLITPQGDFHDISAHETRLHPDRFSLSDIQRAAREDERDRDDEGADVVVQLGNLLSYPDGAKPPATDLNLKSLILGRGIHPKHVQIRSEGEQDDDRDTEGRNNDERDRDARNKGAQKRFEGSFLEVRFSREALLKFLPRVRFDKPIQPGDKLSVDLNGRMKNGVSMTASVVVHIADEKRDHDKDKEAHHNEREQ